MTRFQGAPSVTFGWRTRLVNLVFGKKRLKVLGVAVGFARPPQPQVLGLIVASFKDGDILATVYLTPPEAKMLAEELVRQIGHQSIAYDNT